MNNDIEAKRKKADKWKLRYAYIIAPLLIMMSIGGNIASEAYRQTRQIITLPHGAIFELAMKTYLPTILPPIAIRFGYFTRGLNYGLELYISMCISVVASLLLAFLMMGISGGTLGLLGTLSVYCVMSYGASGYNDIPRTQRYVLTLLTLVAPFLCMHVLSSSELVGKQIYPPYMPIWEAIFIAVMLNCHLPQKYETPPSSSKEQAVPPHEHKDFSSTETTETIHNPKQDIAKRLVCTGLACIGRKSQYPNPYLTPEREDIRHKAEYSFLRQLAQKYHDADARKLLAKHFMLYKEMLLSLTFSILLKKDAELHNLVKKELSIWLTKGLSADVAIRRKDYMYEFSKAFYDEYKRTKNLELALNYSFWQVAAERYPDIVSPAELPTLMRFSGLLDIYNYIHHTLEKEI